MSTIAFIDPGASTGVAIFDIAIPSYLVEVGTVKDTGTLADYCQKLRKMQHKHVIEIAVIEDYQNFGKQFRNAAKVQQQIRACQDVFAKRIMCRTGQWNPRHFKDSYKRMLAASAFNRVFSNSHTTDAAMMGHWFAGWICAWARFCQLKPDQMAHIIALEFGRIPRHGEMQGWAEEYNHKKKPLFTRDAEFGEYGQRLVNVK